MSSPSTRTSLSDRRNRQRANYTPKVSDKKLIPRIKEYFSSLSGSRQRTLSADEVVTSLQEHYQEYARRKRQPFTLQVKEVCEWLKGKQQSAGRVSKLESQHLARKYQSEMKNCSPHRVQDNDGEEEGEFSSGSLSPSDSGAEFELDLSENPSRQKSANRMNSMLQAVYQSRGPHSSPASPLTTSVQSADFGEVFTHSLGTEVAQSPSVSGPQIPSPLASTGVGQERRTSECFRNSPISILSHQKQLNTTSHVTGSDVTGVPSARMNGSTKVLSRIANPKPFCETRQTGVSNEQECGERESLSMDVSSSESPLPLPALVNGQSSDGGTASGMAHSSTPAVWRASDVPCPSPLTREVQEEIKAEQGGQVVAATPLKSSSRKRSSALTKPRRGEEQQLDRGEDEGSLSQRKRKRRKQSKNGETDYLQRASTGDGSSASITSDPDFIPVKSAVRFSDVGGNEDTLKEVCKLLLHLRHPEFYEQLGISPPRGFLLAGPPGCGKSLLADAIAGELDLPYFRVPSTEIVSGISGESEEKLRKLFQVAKASAPCIVFLDEIDAISPKRETSQRGMERRIVSQLLACLDDLNKPSPNVSSNSGNHGNDGGDGGGGPVVGTGAGVLVIGATNRVDALDPALRRAGRFDKEIWMGIPNERAREKILSVMCRGVRLGDVTFQKLAELSPGFVGADLSALVRETAVHVVERTMAAISPHPPVRGDFPSPPIHPGDSCLDDQSVSDDKLVPMQCVKEDDGLERILRILKQPDSFPAEMLSSLSLTLEDFTSALTHVQPSAKREGFATVPDVSWSDIGALDHIREELKMAILAPVQYSREFTALGLESPPGVLLTGPPGCGKTLLAKAVANESRLNFLSVKGPELLNMYVGESERAVRQVFQRARNSAPCVIFFDELDALCPRRSDHNDSNVSGRVVNQLLTEMDGVSARRKVFIMAATNRPDIIDPAILRPGRIDKTLYVGLPSTDGRAAILKTITKNGQKPLLASDVQFSELAEDSRSTMYTGADLSALVREAATAALKEFIGASTGTELFSSTSEKTAGCEASRDCSQITVSRRHFDAAFDKVLPSVSKQDMTFYNELERKYGHLA